MEIKLDKTTKILLGLIAIGLFLNASNVWLDKAYAQDKVQKVVICDPYEHFRCSYVRNGQLKVSTNTP